MFDKGSDEVGDEDDGSGFAREKMNISFTISEHRDHRKSRVNQSVESLKCQIEESEESLLFQVIPVKPSP